MQREQLRRWVEDEAYPAAIAKQRARFADLEPSHRWAFEDCWLRGEPYYGAAGGGPILSFRPSGLGMIVSAIEPITGLQKRLTADDTL